MNITSLDIFWLFLILIAIQPLWPLRLRKTPPSPHPNQPHTA
jgi:hypothetical protein